MTLKHKMQIMLAYGGTKGNKLMTKMKKQLKEMLQNTMKTIGTYQSKKLSIKFCVKDKTNFYNKNFLIYHGECR